MSEVTGLQWANAEPYKNIENNPRIRDGEIIWCVGDCGDEAVVVADDGTRGLCQYHYDRYDRYEERLSWAQNND